MSYYSDLYDFLVDNYDLFLDGLWLTLRICVISVTVGFVIAIFCALAKISNFKPIKIPVTIYVELFRGIPLLVQILFMSFAYPILLRDVFGITPVLGTWTNPEKLHDVIIILSLNTGAYQTEIIRAGIESIPIGQMEAARAVGMNYPEAMRYIILPQAIRVVFPPLANEFINLVLNSSLVAVVAVRDLTFWAIQIAAESFRTLETWFIVGALYYSLTFTLSRMFGYLERKYRIPGLGTA